MAKSDQVTEIPESGICPWCGHPLKDTTRSYSGYEGDFISCQNCKAIFAQVRVGSQFTIGRPFSACTVYQVIAIDAATGLITCDEIAKVNCSSLSKPNKNYYTYLNRGHIISAMAGHYREGMI